jgi:hypothetical protein
MNFLLFSLLLLFSTCLEKIKDVGHIVCKMPLLKRFGTQKNT